MVCNMLIADLINGSIILFVIYHNDLVEVSVWFHSVCPCAYFVHEQVGSVEVCAQIAFINGTSNTVRDYDVAIATDNTSASASKLVYP